jgi:glutathione S-transferase
MHVVCTRDDVGELRSADQYRPPYVRLRLVGGRELNVSSATGWTGITSVATEGFDACVVPTLVDYEANRVVVDSLRIIHHLANDADPQKRLRSVDPDTQARIDAQVSIVDETPHGMLLAGFHPDDDTRPELLRQAMVTYHLDKIPVLERHIENNRAEESLVAAYRAKIAKEELAEDVGNDAGANRRSRLATQKILEQLEDDLSQSSTTWLCTPDVSLADLVWAVSLFRIKYLGIGKLWDRLPGVARYYERLIQLPAVREGAMRPTLDFLPPSSSVGAELLA